MWFYVFMCYSWGYKVLKWVIMVYIVSVSSFLPFGGSPGTSIMFERFALKRPCVSMHASSCLTCFFSIKFMCEFLKFYTIIFGLKKSGQTSPRTIQGSLRKDTSWCPRLPKAAHQRIAIDAQWVTRRPVGGVSSIDTYFQRKWTKETQHSHTTDK